jgi:hypothetical protein
MLEIGWEDPRPFEGTTVCVDVEDIEEEDEGAGECDLISAEVSGDGIGVVRSRC